MDQKTLTVASAEWTDQAAAMLSRSIHDPLVGIETLAEMVQSKDAQLYAVLADGEMVAAYVMRVVECQHGTEAVMVAGAADMPGFRVAPVIISFVDRQYAGVDRVRINASRPGMARILSRLGFAQQSVEMVKDHVPR